MEKLLNLLNEKMEDDEKNWPKHSRFLNYDDINHVFRLNNGCSFCVEFVLSKRYGFIKRLVNKDKIDLMKLKKWIEDNKFYCAKWGKITNMLIMLLSIQDEPIRFLISLLK